MFLKSKYVLPCNCRARTKFEHHCSGHERSNSINHCSLVCFVYVFDSETCIVMWQQSTRQCKHIRKCYGYLTSGHLLPEQSYWRKRTLIHLLFENVYTRIKIQLKSKENEHQIPLNLWYFFTRTSSGTFNTYVYVHVDSWFWTLHPFPVIF